MLRVPQLSEYLSGMAARIEVIGVRDGLAFASLLAAVASEDVLVVVVVEVLVLVEMRLGHSSWSWVPWCAQVRSVADARRKSSKMGLMGSSHTTARPKDRFDTGCSALLAPYL